MNILTREFTDLDRALDEVRSLLYDWSTDLAEASSPPPEAIRYTQLVLHEWIANLLQHADFGDRSPSIEIHLTSEDRHITCTVIDNSEGFNLQQRLPSQEEAMEDLPERGMGLRIIDACTTKISYDATENGCHRFKFSIPADHDPWLSMLF